MPDCLEITSMHGGGWFLLLKCEFRSHTLCLQTLLQRYNGPTRYAERCTTLILIFVDHFAQVHLISQHWVALAAQHLARLALQVALVAAVRSVDEEEAVAAAAAVVVVAAAAAVAVVAAAAAVVAAVVVAVVAAVVVVVAVAVAVVASSSNSSSIISSSNSNSMQHPPLQAAVAVVQQLPQPTRILAHPAPRVLPWVQPSLQSCRLQA